MSDTGTPTDLEKLQEHVRQRLRSQVRELHVILHEGHVLLRGVAVSYYAKQLAQHLVLRVLGQTPLLNRIDVCREAVAPQRDERGPD
jgi:osmotically-inducible protein OsmY